jgi:hypothetical protein
MGAISVVNDIDKVIECENCCVKEFDALVAPEELEKLFLKLDLGDYNLIKRPIRETDSGATFKSAQDTNNIDLVEDHQRKQVVIRANMDIASENMLIEFLRGNGGIFLWKPSNMSNVLRELAEHHLRVDKDVNPVKHPL